MSIKFLNLDLELVLIICKYLTLNDCKNLIFTNKKFSHELVLKSIKRQFTEIKIDKYGTKIWYINGELHREDGPASEYSDGTKLWYINDKLHREDGPAIEHSSGTKHWYINGELHREDGPAIEWENGHKLWYINGKYHREDGPAIECSNGYKEWWLNGEKLTEDEFNNYLKLNEK